MKFLTTSIVLVLIIILCCSVSLAETASSIVNNFIIAAQSKDKILMKKAVDELKINLEAQNILKKDWPNYFTLFNLSQLSEKIKVLKKNYGFSSTSITIKPITPNTAKGLPSNRDLAFARNVTNRIAVRRQDFVNNSTIVRQLSNQNRESNQESIRRRR